MKIDGREIANGILVELKNRVQRLKEKGISPHLAIILVGDSPESKSYVEQKELKGNNIGIKISVKNLPSNTSQQDILKTIEQFNNDENVHGIIVQRPVKNVKSSVLNNAVSPEKDVDSFNPNSPYNPPIAEASLRLLEHIYSSNKIIDQDFIGWLNSHNTVILGKGETGGYPIIKTFEKINISFSVVDSKTENQENLIKNADIIISAVGKPKILTPEKIKRGVVLIGVGLSKDEDGKLKGDYSGKEVKEIASFYTPTPGGVGPVNVAMLLKNLTEASEKFSS